MAAAQEDGIRPCPRCAGVSVGRELIAPVSSRVVKSRMFVDSRRETGCWSDGGQTGLGTHGLIVQWMGRLPR